MAPVVAMEGCEVWGVEYRAQGKHSKLAIYIDNDEGISVDHCERVSRRVSDVLDVEEVLSSAYTLEVSSPGMDRILFKPAQYESCAGEEIEVRLELSGGWFEAHQRCPHGSGRRRSRRADR